ncbi:hypothetical protein GDO78_003532 [Eleutherodactylus coqui]|uniref:Uncharacterized protein n=1 Tax=Eleutherodactylus coqui TaxID=57060 RepID=A0A8J6EUN6_ELECQ|nr:hypothetical protein GDO78_003532 [Eleutherodactylus coqui]
MAVRDNDSLLETQEPAEFPQKVCSPCEEQREKDLTEALLEISEKVQEEDHKSIQWRIGTGWEEAASGWGPLSATACLHPPKTQKRLKHGDAADCILCPDLCFISASKDTAVETKPNHKDKPRTEPSGTDHVLLPAENGFTGHCPSTVLSQTESRNSKDSSLDVAIKEQRQAKKDLQSSSSPFTGKAIPICTNCYNTKEPLMYNTPMLLPPLKASPGNGHAEQMARRREILLQQLVKIPSNGVMGNFPTGEVLHNLDVGLERKRLDAMSDLLRGPEPLSFVTSCIPRTPIKDADCLQWPYSLLAQKSTAGNANSAPVGSLHTRTMHNKRSSHQETRPLNETKVRRAKSGSSQVPDTVLPSLIVTRVDIPAKIKPC